MYTRWFTDGKPQTPAVDAEARERARGAVVDCRNAVRRQCEEEQRESSAAAALTDDEAAAREWAAAVALLTAEGGGDAAAALLPNDYYRLARALEIVWTSGRARESFGVHAAPEWDYRCFFMHGPRIPMYRRIDQRCEQMVRLGPLRLCAPAPSLRRGGVRTRRNERRLLSLSPPFFKRQHVTTRTSAVSRRMLPYGLACGGVWEYSGYMPG